MRRLLLASFAALLSLPAFGQSQNYTPFGNISPNFGGTQAISATTTTASVTLTAADSQNSVLRLTNAGASTAFCRWGNGAQTALTTDFPVLSGVAINVFKPPVLAGQGLTQVVACITAASTATVYVTTGTLY